MLKYSDNLSSLKYKGCDDLICLQKHGAFSVFNIYRHKLYQTCTCDGYVKFREQELGAVGHKLENFNSAISFLKTN